MLESKQTLAYDDPSKTFVGVRFILHGFDSVREEKVRSKLLEGGGIDAVNYGADCNHVIVDKLVYDDPICVAARRDGKILVTGLWVDHSFDVGMPVDPASVMYMPMRDLNGIPGAKSLVVCLTGYQRQDRDDIMIMVTLMGANFSKPLVANKVTHLICYKFEGEKYELAKKIKKIKLVNHRWLEDCLKAWELLPESDYAKSTYELETEMEAEAKDSEDETEDIASKDLKKKSAVSPQNTRVENIIFRQSPMKQEVSRNRFDLNASESLANVGDTSRSQLTPSKEIKNGEASISHGTHDKHLDKSSSYSARSPGKISSEVPPSILDGSIISEKVDHVLASASGSAKKSPDAALSKLSSKSRKSSLPLRPERTEIYSSSPSATNVSKPDGGFAMPSERDQDGTDGVKTPLKGTSLHLDDRQTVSSPSKGKTAVSHGSSRSPMSSNYTKTSMGSGLAKRATELPVSGSSVDGSRQLASDISPTNVTSHLREEVSGGFDMPLGRRQDGNDSDGVKTPLKRTSLHLGEGQNASSPSKRKMTVSHGSPRSPMSSNYTKTLMGSGLAKRTELRVSGCSVDGSRQLASDISPTNATSHLNMEASVGFDMPLGRRQDGNDSDRVKTPLNGTSLHLDDGQNASSPSKRKMTVSRGSSRSPLSSHYPKQLTGSGLATKTMELLVSGSSIDGSHGLADYISPTNITSHLREESSFDFKEALNISATSEDRQECNDQALQRSQEGLEKMDGQPDSNFPKVDHSGTKLKPMKRKMLAKKTLGSRPTICKGSTTKHKSLGSRLVNMQNAVLQNGQKSHSNGAVAMEDADNSTIAENVLVAPPTSNKDGPVNNETKASDDKDQNEFDDRSNKENSAKVRASHSGKSATRTKKQAGGKTKQVKEKGPKSVGVKSSNEAEKSVSSEKTELPESKSTDDAGEKKITKGKKRPLTKSKMNKLKDPGEEVKNDESKGKQDEKETVPGNEETVVLAGKANQRPSKKLKSSADEEKENRPATIRQQSVSSDTGVPREETSQPLIKPSKSGSKADKCNHKNPEVRTQPAWFILSGHRLQRKEFQQVIRRLKGRVCRDSHNWSYQATHFIVPDPVRRVEKFFAAAASGSWILKTDYLTASNEAGRFLSEEPYEWHKKCLTEDGAINLEAPRKWRLLKEKTGHGAFYGMRIVIYGECIAPPLETLKRVVKAGDGTILATSPPYTRFLKSGIDFAIVSPGMPRVDMWVQEFLRHEVPCIVADYLVEYVCKPGYSLDRHVQYNTHAWAKKSLENLVNRVEEVVEDPKTPEDDCNDDVACQVCGSRDRGEEMLICGDESGSHGCGVGVHFDCLDPPLEGIPVEDWFCQKCSQHTKTKIVSRKSNKKSASKSKR